MAFFYYQFNYAAAVARMRNKYMRHGRIQPTDATMDAASHGSTP